MLPWGLYEYIALPMGLAISSDIFQSRMSALFQDLPYVFVYCNNIFIMGSGSFEEHLENMALVLDRLIKMGMQANPLKLAWAVDEVDYLGFNIIREGIKPQKKKVDAIDKIPTPTTQSRANENSRNSNNNKTNKKKSLT